MPYRVPTTETYDAPLAADIACPLRPYQSLGNSIALSSANLNWASWQFTVGGNLEISHIDPAGAPDATAAATTQSGRDFDSENPASAASTYSYPNNAGRSTATASANTGVLSASASALALDTSNNFAQSNTSTGITFWLYGRGTGTVTVSVPYQLTATCSPPAFNELSSAHSSVLLFTGPGVSAGGDAAASLSCAEGASKTGTPTVTQFFNNPGFGPLVLFEASAEADAVASIPDSGSSVILLATALLALVVAAGSVRRPCGSS